MDFVMVANSWEAGRSNPTSKHRIALELARRGHRVLWISGAGMRAPSLGAKADRSRLLRRIVEGMRPAVPASGQQRVWVLAPLLVPMPSVGWIRRLNGWLYRVAIERSARALGFQSPVLINYVPVLGYCMAGWKGRVVYHCVDRWSAFAMYDSVMMERMDTFCCRHANLVVASSLDLYEQCRRKNAMSRLVGHGVDHAHFARALTIRERPSDLPAGPIVGFFGLLSEWLDQDLILRLARELPRAQIVLIGTADVDVSRLRGVANLHLLGPRPFVDLPSYIAAFEVGIIPFVVNELTSAVNPIKLLEMLAAGCPVVSTALPEVERCVGTGGEGSLSISRLDPGEEFTTKSAKGTKDGGWLASTAGGTGRSAMETRRPPESDASDVEGGRPRPPQDSGKRSLGAAHVARDADEFIRRVGDCVRGPASAEERRAISASVRNETWESRVNTILQLISELDT